MRGAWMPIDPASLATSQFEKSQFVEFILFDKRQLPCESKWLGFWPEDNAAGVNNSTRPMLSMQAVGATE